MRIVITGAGGMLGTDACRILAELGHTICPTDRHPLEIGKSEQVDITDFESVRGCMSRNRPDAVLHCAAYTNVDGAERDPDTAFRANAIGAWNVAAAAEEVGAALAVVSSDFVFDGEKGSPYTEFDTPSPISQYGASKLSGENLARQACSRVWIVRTSWLYGVHGKNFPYAMAKLGRTRDEIPVVADQTGTPTYTVDLARAIGDLISRPVYGVYHVSNDGETTWAEFARTVLKGVGLATPVRSISSDEYAQMSGSPTRRPRYSVLRNYAMELQGRPAMRPWTAAFDEFSAAARAAGKL